MWSRLLTVAICLIVQPNVFCNEYRPVLDDHGGTAALHISATKLDSSTQRCGAILISDRHLLTAASCLKGKESERIVSISLGREDLDQNPTPGNKDSYEIEDTIIHPDYGYGKHEYNDLAILKTNRKVQYGAKVWPYCLPEKDQKFPQFLPVQIAGWGYVNQTHKTPHLHVAYVKLMEIPRCVSGWRQHASDLYDNIIRSSYPQGLDDRIRCAGRQGVDACIGDSGGPMTNQNQYGRNVLIGVIASRNDCPDQPTTPGFYTNIPHYVDWIYATTGRSQQQLSKDCGGSQFIQQQPGGVEVETEDNSQVAGDTVFPGGAARSQPVSGSGNVSVNIRSHNPQ